MNFTMRADDRFPVGTTVSVYPILQLPSSRLGAPSGTALTSAVVAADSSVIFSGLADETDYFAYANVSGGDVYVTFRVDLGVPTYADFARDFDPLLGRPFINPKASAWGALGDGVTDDWKALQAAINDVSSGLIILPPGTYVVSQPLVLPYAANGLTIMGSGAGLTGAAKTTIQYTGTTEYPFELGGGTAGNFTRFQTIRGLEIVGSAGAQGAARFRGTRWCTIEECHIHGFPAAGPAGVLLDADSVAQYANYYNRIVHNFFDTMAYGVYLKGEATAGTGGNSNLVAWNTFNNCTTNGVIADGGDTNMVLKNEFGTGTGTGVRFTGTNSACSYNTALSNQFDGCAAGVQVDNAAATANKVLFNDGPNYTVTDTGTGTVLRDNAHDGTRYVAAAGKTTVVDGDFAVAPANGTVCVHFDTTAARAYVSVRANNVWHVMAGPVA